MAYTLVTLLKLSFSISKKLIIMNLREFWRFHFLKALLGLVAIQLIVIAIIQNYNNKPIAQRDTLSVIENRELKIKPLTNDTDKDENTELILLSHTNPLHGKAKMKGNSIIYSPEKGYVGFDSLSYIASDGKKESKAAYIVIDIKENRAAIPVLDKALVYAGKKVIINALANDSDNEGDSIYIQEFTQPLHGKLEVMKGDFVYTAGQIAVSDSFQYAINDGKSISIKATVLVNVKSKTDACYPWLNSDLGNTAVAGSTQCKNNKIKIETSGSDIWDTRDGLHFVYQDASGDCEIIAKVESLEANHEWAKAGVMIRENLSGGSANIYLGISNKHGTGFQCRYKQDESSNSMGGKEGINPPYWFKLNRKGDTFSTYTSVDGIKWEETGSENVAMNRNVYIGLSATSHNNQEMANMVFSNVKIKR